MLILFLRETPADSKSEASFEGQSYIGEGVLKEPAWGRFLLQGGIQCE